MWITTPLHGPKYAASFIVQARTLSRARMRSRKVFSNGLSRESELSWALRWNGRTRNRSKGAASEAGRLTQTSNPQEPSRDGTGQSGFTVLITIRFFLVLCFTLCVMVPTIQNHYSTSPLLTSLSCIVRRPPCMTHLGTCIAYFDYEDKPFDISGTPILLGS